MDHGFDTRCNIGSRQSGFPAECIQAALVGARWLVYSLCSSGGIGQCGMVGCSLGSLRGIGRDAMVGRPLGCSRSIGQCAMVGRSLGSSRGIGRGGTVGLVYCVLPAAFDLAAKLARLVQHRNLEMEI